MGGKSKAGPRPFPSEALSQNGIATTLELLNRTFGVCRNLWFLSNTRLLIALWTPPSHPRIFHSCQSCDIHVTVKAGHIGHSLDLHQLRQFHTSFDSVAQRVQVPAFLATLDGKFLESGEFHFVVCFGKMPSTYCSPFGYGKAPRSPAHPMSNFTSATF